MASIDQIRNEYEAKIGSGMQQLAPRHRKRIERAIVEHGSIDAIPVAFWRDLQQDIEDALAAALLALVIAASESTESQLRTEIPGEERQQIAQRHASQQARVVSADYVANTRDALRAKLERPVETLPQLRRRVADVVSPGRAERLAVTETTNGISAGQNGAADVVERERPDLEVQRIWRTERDTRVCPICSPLDNTPADVWGRHFPTGPAAHVNCRCELVVKSKRQRAISPPRARPAFTRGGLSAA